MEVTRSLAPRQHIAGGMLFVFELLYISRSHLFAFKAVLVISS